MSRLQRRTFLLGAGTLLAAPLVCLGQQPDKVRRIGFLAPFLGGHPGRELNRRVLPQLLSELGYHEGKNLIIEWRFPASSLNEMSALAEELVRMRVEVIIANTEAITPASLATRDIPIVMLYATNPIENGWIKSLTRPGGNITGATWSEPDQASKSIELIRETVPHATRVAATYNPTFPNSKLWTDAYDAAAKIYGMTLEYLPVTRTEDIDPALQRIASLRPDAFFVPGEGVVISNGRKIADFAIGKKLIMVSNAGPMVEQGGLACHEPDREVIRKRVASYVDRILRGAKPADLPVELPSKFLVILNAKTARAIGYTIPQSLRLRADRVIE